MIRLLRLALFLFLSIPMRGQAAAKHVGATKITSYWSAAGACPTPNCVTGYTLTITQPSGAIATIPLPSTTTSYAWTPGGNLAWGPYEVTITTNVIAGVTTTPPSTIYMVYASGVSTGTAPGGFAIRYTQ